MLQKVFIHACKIIMGYTFATDIHARRVVQHSEQEAQFYFHCKTVSLLYTYFGFEALWDVCAQLKLWIRQINRADTQSICRY